MSTRCPNFDLEAKKYPSLPPAQTANQPGSVYESTGLVNSSNRTKVQTLLPPKKRPNPTSLKQPFGTEASNPLPQCHCRPSRRSQATESQSKPGIKMVVIPEPCFKNLEGGYPQLFLAGIAPYSSSTRVLSKWLNWP